MPANDFGNWAPLIGGLNFALCGYLYARPLRNSNRRRIRGDRARREAEKSA